MASNGNYRNLHQYSNELCGDGTNTSDEEDSVYKSMFMNEEIKPLLIFGFGKAASEQSEHLLRRLLLVGFVFSGRLVYSVFVSVVRF